MQLTPTQIMLFRKSKAQQCFSTLFLILFLVLGSSVVGVLPGFAQDGGAPSSTEATAQLIEDYCMGMDANSLGVHDLVSDLPARFNGIDVWVLRGQAWGPAAGYINFGPLYWGDKNHYVISYKDPEHPIPALRDKMIFEGYAWGENVGWINMNTGYYFCNNPTSFENFFDDSLTLEQSIEVMKKLNGNIGASSYSGPTWPNAEDFFNGTDELPPYIFPDLDKRDGWAASVVLDTIKKAVGPDVNSDIGPYQISLHIDAVGSDGERSVVDTGFFTWDNMTDPEWVRPQRVFVQGQAWSKQMGAIYSHPQSSNNWYSNETYAAHVSPEEEGGASIDQLGQPGFGIYADLANADIEPPLHIAPFFRNGDQVAATTRGQLVGNLWSPRLGWIYFAPVKLGEGDVIERGVIFEKHNRKTQCPAPIAVPSQLIVTSGNTEQELSLYVPAEMVADPEDGSKKIEREVSIWGEGALVTFKDGGSGSEPSREMWNEWGPTENVKLIPSGSPFAKGPEAPPIQVRCHEDFPCATGTNPKWQLYAKTNETVKVDIKVNFSSSIMDNVKSVRLIFSGGPKAGTEESWDAECIPSCGPGGCRPDDVIKRREPTPTPDPDPDPDPICDPTVECCPTCQPDGTCPFIPTAAGICPGPDIVEVGMCSVGNLTYTFNGCVTPETAPGIGLGDAGDPRVQLGFYVQPEIEHGRAYGNTFTVLELYDVTENSELTDSNIVRPSSAIVPASGNVLNAEASLNDNSITSYFSNVVVLEQQTAVSPDNTVGGTPKPYSEVMQISRNRVYVELGDFYTLGPGTRYQAVIRSVVPPDSAPSSGGDEDVEIPTSYDTVTFSTEAACSDPAELMAFASPTGRMVASLFGAISTPNTHIPSVPIEVYTKYAREDGGDIGAFGEVDDFGNENGSVRINVVKIKPHVVPLPYSAAEEIDYGSPSSTNTERSTRITSLQYSLFRAKIKGGVIEEIIELEDAIPHYVLRGPVYEEGVPMNVALANAPASLEEIMTGTSFSSQAGLRQFAGGDPYRFENGVLTNTGGQRYGLFLPQDPSKNETGEFIYEDSYQLQDGEEYAYILLADSVFEIWKEGLLLSDEPGVESKNSNVFRTHTLQKGNRGTLTVRGMNVKNSPLNGTIERFCSFENYYSQTGNQDRNSTSPRSTSGSLQSIPSASCGYYKKTYDTDPGCENHNNKSPSCFYYECTQPGAGNFLERISFNKNVTIYLPEPNGTVDSLKKIPVVDKMIENANQPYDFTYTAVRDNYADHASIDNYIASDGRLIAVGTTRTGAGTRSVSGSLLNAGLDTQNYYITALNAKVGATSSGGPSGGYGDGWGKRGDYFTSSKSPAPRRQPQPLEILPRTASWVNQSNDTTRYQLQFSYNQTIQDFGRSNDECSMYANLAENDYVVIPYIEHSAVIANVKSRYSEQSKSAKLDVDNLEAFVNQPYSKVVKEVLNTSLWNDGTDLETVDSLPRSMVGFSRVVATPTLANNPKLRVDAGCFDRNGNAIDNAAGSECEQTRQSFSAVDFEQDVLRSAGGLARNLSFRARSYAQPAPVFSSSVSGVCTNQMVDGSSLFGTEDGATGVDPAACSRAGYVVAGSSVKVSLFDIKDISCRYIHDPSPTEEDGYDYTEDSEPIEVEIVNGASPEEMSYMYYWGGTSNPEFTDEPCTDFANPAGCTQYPVLLSLEPDYYAIKSCPESIDTIDEARSNKCTLRQYSNRFVPNGGESSYQPIDLFILGYNVLSDENSGVNRNDALPIMYSGRWSLQIKGLRISRVAGGMEIPHQRTMFVVKPAIPVFSPEDMAQPSIDLGIGPLLEDLLIPDVVSRESYSRVGIQDLNSDFSALASGSTVPFIPDEFPRYTGEGDLNKNLDFNGSFNSYRAIADGYSGYGLVADLRDRFGNRIVSGDSSYDLDGGEDEVTLRMTVLPNDEEGNDGNLIVSEQITTDADYDQHFFDSMADANGRGGGDPVYGAGKAMQVVGLSDGTIDDSGDLTYANVEKTIIRTFDQILALTGSELETYTTLELQGPLDDSDERFVKTLYAAKVVSLGPTLETTINNARDFSGVRSTEMPQPWEWNDDVDTPLFHATVSLKDGNGLGAERDITDVPVHFTEETACGGDDTGADCFDAKMEEYDGTSTVREWANKFAGVANTHLSAIDNLSFRRDVQYYPAIETSCSFLGGSHRPGADNDFLETSEACGVYHLDPFFEGTSVKYNLRADEFEVIQGKTERFLIVLRSNLSSPVQAEDLELKLNFDLGAAGNVIAMENLYPEKVCSRADQASGSCDVLSDESGKRLEVNFEDFTLGNAMFPNHIYPDVLDTAFNYSGFSRLTLSLLSNDPNDVPAATPAEGYLHQLQDQDGNFELKPVFSEAAQVLFHLLASNDNNDKSDTPEQDIVINPGDIILIRVAGTPFLRAGSETESISARATSIETLLSYRVGHTTEINNGGNPNVDYPMTAHYSGRFSPGSGSTGPGPGIDPPSFTNTCQIDIRGRVRAENIYSIIASQSEGIEASVATGQDTYLNAMNRLIKYNVAQILRTGRSSTSNDPNAGNENSPLVIAGGTTFSMKDLEDMSGPSKPGILNNGNVVYIKNRNLVLGNHENPYTADRDVESIVFPTSDASSDTPMPMTFIVDGGDVIIKNNIVFERCEESDTGCVDPMVGFIVLRGEGAAERTQRGGSFVIDPHVSQVRGAVYAEGAVLSAEDGWWLNGCNASSATITEGNNKIEDCEIFDGFSSFNPMIANQLYFKGIMISRNTIGGRDDKRFGNVPLLPLDKESRENYRYQSIPDLWWPREIVPKDLINNFGQVYTYNNFDYSSKSKSIDNLIQDYTYDRTEIFRQQVAQRYDLNYLRLCGLAQASVGKRTAGQGLYVGVKDAEGRTWSEVGSGEDWDSTTMINDYIDTIERNPDNPYPSSIIEYDGSIQTNTPPGFEVPRDFDFNEN